MDNKIVFDATMSTEKLESQIKSLQQRLSQSRQNQSYQERVTSIFGEGSGLSQSAQRIFQQNQSDDLKFLKDKFNAMQRLREHQEKAYKANEKALKDENTAEKEKKKILEEQLDIRRKLTQLTKDQIDIGERAKAIDPNLTGFRGVLLPTGAVGGDGGSIPPGKKDTPNSEEKEERKSFFKELRENMRLPAALGFLSQGIKGVSSGITSTFFDYESTRAQKEASIAQGSFAGSGVSDILSGRGTQYHMWDKERMKAIENAKKYMDGILIKEATQVLTKSLEGAAGGAVSGALLGGGNPLAVKIGAIGGGIWGGVNATAHTGVGAWAQGALNPNDSGADALNRLRDKQFLESVNKNIEAEKAKDPFKQTATEYLSSRSPHFLRLQRMGGMSDNQLFETLGEKTGLYTEQQKLQAMEQIGAIGSTAQMGSIGTSLDLTRKYGIQNSNNIIGMLSKNLGGGQVVSDETTKRILADAFSVGLDASNFSRETEKFFSASAQFVAESGARTNEGMQAVSGEMSKFLGEGRSIADIEAAQTARERFNSMLGSGGTQYQKALQMSSMMSNPKLSSLSFQQRSALADMTPDQIRAGGPMLEAFASQLGMENVGDLQKELLKEGGAKDFASTLTPGQSEDINKARELQKQISQEKDPTKKASLQKQLKQLTQGKIVPSLMAMQGKGMDQYKAGSLASGMINSVLPSGEVGFVPELDQSGAFALDEKSIAKSNIAMQNVATKKPSDQLESYISQYANSAKKMSEQTSVTIESLIKLTDALENARKSIDSGEKTNTGLLNSIRSFNYYKGK